MTYNKEYPYNDLPLVPPVQSLHSSLFSDALIKARAEIAELKGYLHSMPIDPMLIISPSILRESLASSEIENIHTTLADVLQAQLLFEDSTTGSGADKEVLRYRSALMWGFDHVGEYGISTRLIVEIQHMLLPDKVYGYKKEQNYIGVSGTKEKIYTPPDPTQVNRLMYNWENFVNISDGTLDPLIRCAIAHYQFEAIHPFEDGNGRTGRILMVLHLIQEGLLSLPTFFISGYLIQHRSAYYAHLRDIPTTNNWEAYILFMLDAFYHQARETKQVVLSAKLAYDQFMLSLKDNYPALYSADLVNALFKYPIINPSKLSDEMGVHRVTASKYLKEMSENGLLKEMKSGTYRLYINHTLLDALHKKHSDK
jgi:Fic family protein